LLFGEFHVRRYLPATAVGLCCLMPLSMASAIPPSVAQPAAPTKAPATTVPIAATTSDGFAAAAAARHTKRTACLQEAKAKKLVGSNKNDYVQDCLTH
jgi:hypothetical protein